MDRKALRKIVDSYGLQLVSYENANGNGAHITLKAPDKTEARFMVNRLDDPHSDKINRAQFRRFARDHNPSLPLPGADEIDDLNMSNMQRAMIAATEKVPSKAIRIVSRVLEHQPLLNPEGVIRNAMEMNEPEQPIVWVSEKPKPTPPEEDPIPESIETIEALIANHPTDLTIMPKPNLTTVASKPSKPAGAKKGTAMRTNRTLTQVEFFRISQKLSNLEMTGLTSIPKLTARLSEVTGEDLSESTVTAMVEATGVKLDKPKAPARPPTEAEEVIARTLTALLIKLSEPVPDELRALCGDIA